MKAKKEKLVPQKIEDLAKDWGIDYQVFKIKNQLIDTIKVYCEKHNVSQRKLSTLVSGLSQDRVSKIFSGQVGHMTIDKLIEILSALEINVVIKAKAA